MLFITSNGHLDSLCILAASFIVSPFKVAPFNPNALAVPPVIAPVTAPHLYPSLPAINPASKAASKSPVVYPVTIPVVIPLINVPDSANVVALFADAANITLTAGVEPAVTIETVTQINITPVPIATFFNISL